MPQNYVSSAALDSLADFASRTFAGMGLIEGTYVYDFGSGNDADRFTVQVGPVASSIDGSSVPEPAPWLLIIAGVGAVTFARRSWLKRDKRILAAPPHHGSDVDRFGHDDVIATSVVRARRVSPSRACALKNLSLASLAVTSALFAGHASADVIHFALTDGANEISFEIATAAGTTTGVPARHTSDSTTFDLLTTLVDGVPSTTDRVSFYDTLYGGGLVLRDLAGSGSIVLGQTGYPSATLFAGTTSAPDFRMGDYRLIHGGDARFNDDFRIAITNLTLAAVVPAPTGAIPEPAPLALVVIGSLVAFGGHRRESPGKSIGEGRPIAARRKGVVQTTFRNDSPDERSHDSSHHNSVGHRRARRERQRAGRSDHLRLHRRRRAGRHSAKRAVSATEAMASIVSTAAATAVPRARTGPAALRRIPIPPGGLRRRRRR